MRAKAANQTGAVAAAVGAATKQAASISADATAQELVALAVESARQTVTDVFADSQVRVGAIYPLLGCRVVVFVPCFYRAC